MTQADDSVSVKEFTESISQGHPNWSDTPQRISDVVFCVTSGVFQGRVTGARQLVPTKFKDRSSLTTLHLSWSRMRAWLKRLGAVHCQVFVGHYTNDRTMLCLINDDESLQATCNAMLQSSEQRAIHVNLCLTRSIHHSLQSSDKRDLYHCGKDDQALSFKKRFLTESQCQPGRENKRARHTVSVAQQSNNPVISQLQEVIELLQQHYVDAIEDLNLEWQDKAHDQNTMIAELQEERDSLKRKCVESAVIISTEEHENQQKYRDLRSSISRTIEGKNHLETKWLEEFASIREEFDQAKRQHEDQQKQLTGQLNDYKRLHRNLKREFMDYREYHAAKVTSLRQNLAHYQRVLARFALQDDCLCGKRTSKQRQELDRALHMIRSRQ